MPRRENLLPLALQLGPVELHLHQLIHIMPDQHVAIELDHAIILHEAEGRKFGPAVVETRVGGVILAFLGEEIFDSLRGDGARGESGMAFGGKGVGVEGYEGVFGLLLLETVVEREEAGKVCGVCNEGCPDYFLLALYSESCWKAYLPFLDSVALVFSAMIEVYIGIILGFRE